MSKKYDLPVYMLGFKRTLDYIKKFNIDLGEIKVIDLLPFKEYLRQVYYSKFIISDSGTAQEEPSLLNTPVIVPRDFTERPESIEHNCSFMINVNTPKNLTWTSSESWLLLNSSKRNTDWLGDGSTSEKIIKILKEKL
jgi:UDP-N-acetylglucosamine 2-epimerase (non-hydrolysing)